MQPLLEFTQVNLPAGPANEIGLADLSFTLEAGALALLEVPAGHGSNPLADLASGLLEPTTGQVQFAGQPWLARSASAAAAARGTIGRVFDEPGWVSNLDVDENVTLPARYHQTMDEADAYRQAQELAVRLGLAGLPAGRPAHVARNELRRAEWVRALLGPRQLVILERPLRELPVGWGAALLAETARLRAAGVAFLWIQTAGQELAVDQLKPTLQFQVERGNIIGVRRHE